jgi:hypothetical protein
LFGSAATVLDLIGQDLDRRNSDDTPLRLRTLYDELMYLHRSHRIEEIASPVNVVDALCKNLAPFRQYHR